MKKYLLFIGLILTLWANNSCSNPKNNQKQTENQNVSNVVDKSPEQIAPTVKQREKTANFLPEGYVVFEEIYGDLNKDGLEDCIVIIKGTDKSKIIKDEHRGELDRNRRGIIVLFDKKDCYELIVKNYDCFSSENEDGGVYFAPELSVSTEKGNLHIQYDHGRYGDWEYVFRFSNSDFNLIGYDASSNYGPIINSKTSINFLTRKKLEKVNVNENAEGGDEIFEDTWSNITVKSMKKLSSIKDFDQLDIPN